MKILLLKCHKNRIINKELDFWGLNDKESGGGGGGVNPNFKKWKNPLHNGGTISQRKFQNSSSIRTRLNLRKINLRRRNKEEERSRPRSSSGGF